MFTKEGILIQGCSWEQAEKLNSFLIKLEKLKASDFYNSENFQNYKTAYNLFLLSKAYLWRLVDLGQSASFLFNNKRIMASLIISRSLMETTVALGDIQKQIQNFILKGNFEGADSFIIEKMFSTRRTDFLEEMPELRATNIVTLISKIEKEAKYEYEVLSEYSHPNAQGHFLGYSDTNFSTGEVKFSELSANKHGIFHLIRLAFYGLEISRINLEALKISLEPLVEFKEDSTF